VRIGRDCSLDGGAGGASPGRAPESRGPGAPSGPRGSSSTAWRRVGCATSRRGWARDGLELVLDEGWDGGAEGVDDGLAVEDSEVWDGSADAVVVEPCDGAASAQGSGSIVAVGALSRRQL
jgi:hypothetical protein